MEADLKLVTVAAAVLIEADSSVLLAQRPSHKQHGGLWEFPGGKLDAGETPEAALARELYEELGIEVQQDALKPWTFVSHAYDTYHVLMPLYLCRTWAGRPEPREGQTLAWVPAPRLSDYAMPPADEPLIALLQAALSA